MSEISRILSRIENGDSGASEQLFPLVNNELRQLAAARMAKERSDHSLQATALVEDTSFLQRLRRCGTFWWNLLDERVQPFQKEPINMSFVSQV